MPFFSNPRYVEINNSQFSDVTVNQSTGPSGIDMLFEVSVPEATYDSSARDPPPRCFPGTREQYVEDILNWALPPVNDTPLPIYWMKGPAGVGKSAVAQTCVEKLRRQRILGAAFFFSINRHSASNNVSINGRGEHYKFFTSIAYQLSTVFPKYRSLLDAKIRHDRSLINKTLESQFWGLIVDPLQELEEEGIGIGKRIPVFVDGLDECEGRDAQREIVEIVAAAARDGAAPLCWAFFSRPEPHIEAAFSKIVISPLCRKAVLPISRDTDGDIELYLKAGFEDMVERLNIIMDFPWPSDSDIKVLVHAAGGLFIYAKTVLRFVGQPDTLNPEELLRVVIAVILNRDQSGSTTESAFAELDAFYMLIMKRIPVKNFATIHRTLAVLCCSSYSSAILIANYLGLSRVELEIACGQLSAVINFQRQSASLNLDTTATIDTSRSFLHASSGQLTKAYGLIWSSLGGSLSFYHKSFLDFLLDPHRSTIYCVNGFYEFFGQKGRDLMLRLEKYHCWQGLELVRAPGAPKSMSSLSYPYGNELVSSLIEAAIYDNMNIRDMFEDADFRKNLYIRTTVKEVVTMRSDIFKMAMFYGSTGFYQYFRGTILGWLQLDEFHKFDITEFKKDLTKLLQKGILRPCDPDPLFLDKPKGRVESGLYFLGRDSQSIFWFWEINHDLKTYREFRALDLAEGQRLYRENQPAVQSILGIEPLLV